MLCLPAASAITGQAIAVAGGEVMTRWTKPCRPRIAEIASRSAASDDKLELRVWLRLLTCTNLIEARGPHAGCASNFDTTLPRFDLLAQLDRAPEGLTMGELSRR